MEPTVSPHNEDEENNNNHTYDNVITKAVEQLGRDSRCLDIGQQQLISFPENLYVYCENLKFLYLEGNALERLPDSLFPSLPLLQWLDVRNNVLQELPQSIAHHRSLEVLLLQGNQLCKLPLELGLVPRLRGLQLAGNPLQVPPSDVVRNGIQAVLSYLRQQWALSTRSPPAVRPIEKLVYKDTKKDHACSGISGPKSRRSATGQERCPVRVPRPKVKSADLAAITVRGYCYSRELVAPKTTPALTHDCESPDIKTNEKIRHLNSFRSVEEKIFHLWPSASTDEISREKMELRVQEKYLKQACISKLKEMLQRQATVLQRRSDANVLKLWRKDAKYTKTRPKKSIAPPYGTDPNYSNMLSRAEARDPAARQRRNAASSARVCRNLDEEMKDLLCKLREPCATSNMSPRTEQRALYTEIQKLTELQRRLQALKLRNNCADRSSSAPKKQ